MKSRASNFTRMGFGLALLAPLSACSVDASTKCPQPAQEPGVLAPLGDCSDGESSSEVTGAGGATGGASAAGAAATGGASQYANFATMVQIVQVKCGGSGCHTAGGQAPQLLGVDNATLYSTLKSYVVKDCGNQLLVQPGAPQQSAFYLVQNGQCGSAIPQMPLGCSDETCTPPDYIEGVRQWIANGASQQ
jgi:hypothetical protein